MHECVFITITIITIGIDTFIIINVVIIHINSVMNQWECQKC